MNCKRLTLRDVKAWREKTRNQNGSLTDFEILNMRDNILKRSLLFYSIEIDNIFDAERGDIAAKQLISSARAKMIEDISFLVWRNYN